MKLPNGTNGGIAMKWVGRIVTGLLLLAVGWVGSTGMDHEVRLVRAESQLEHLPSPDMVQDIQDLKVDVKEVRTTNDTAHNQIVERLTRIEAKIDDH